jgi:hypothetical protein
VTQCEKRKLCGKSSHKKFSPFSILHSPYFTRGGEEWNSQSSNNGPSAFQGERATSPFFED